ALVVFALALLLVIVTSGGDSEPETSGSKQADKARDLGASKKPKTRTTETETTPSPSATKATYVVKTGDTLGQGPLLRLHRGQTTFDRAQIRRGERTNLLLHLLQPGADAVRRPPDQGGGEQHQACPENPAQGRGGQQGSETIASSLRALRGFAPALHRIRLRIANRGRRLGSGPGAVESPQGAIAFRRLDELFIEVSGRGRDRRLIRKSARQIGPRRLGPDALWIGRRWDGFHMASALGDCVSRRPGRNGRS
ncbi:MAG: hypothetical protein AVDCRST_MAG90-2891, partial [uncultured Microvirga sp.]